jgi:tetratricopeptide (TPR) repeat protein
MQRRYFWPLFAGAVCCILGGAFWLHRANTLEAQRLHGRQLLENLHGYLKVGRIAEAATVLDALQNEDESRDYLDQARYEVAHAYVEDGKGELAISLLDQISLHDRSFDFQRAVLREKLRGLHSFFFDPSGDLRAPAQIDDFVFHSKLNPHPADRIRDPKGFEDSNKLLDYFNVVARQLEDIMIIQGLKRSAEPALAEGYDTIQILLYGRGLISHDELTDRLKSSQTGQSARTLYLLGNQYFVEADYDRAFQTWGQLVAAAPEDKGTLRAFIKTYELFEGRRLLAKAFAFWPLQRPAWMDTLVPKEPFKSEAASAAKRLATHEDLAKYAEVTRDAMAATASNRPDDRVVRDAQDIVVPPDILAKAELGDHFETINPDRPDEHLTTMPLILDRKHDLGWRLQTEFREFMLLRGDTNVLTPSQKKPLIIRSSYHGEVRFESRRFADGNSYRKFQTLSPAQAVEATVKLPVVKSWTENVGSLSENGRNMRHDLFAPISEPGFYLITARVRYAPVVALTQMAVVAEKVLTWASPSGVLFRTVDRESGGPVSGARLHGEIEPHYDLAKVAPQFFDGSRTENFRNGFAGGFNIGKRDELAAGNDDFLQGFNEGVKLREKFPLVAETFEVKTADDGTANLPIPEKWKGVACGISATLNELGNVCPIKATCAQPAQTKTWQALFYAERPIFQPGEKVRLKGMLRKLDGSGLSLPGDEELEFMLWNGNSLYGVFHAKPNAVGTVVFEAPLPENATLGAYHLTIGHDGQHYPVFRVDRGERPLLELSVRPDADVIFAGATVHGHVQVTRLGNVAAVGVPVALRVYRGDVPTQPAPEDPREDFFTPVALQEYPNDDSQAVLEHRLGALKEVWHSQGVTDAKGEFAFSFDSDRQVEARYLILAESKALPGRREIGTADVLSHDLPIFLDVTPERFSYYPGETLRARVRTRALDGKNASASLRIEVGADQGKTGRQTDWSENIKTDRDGQAQLSVALGKSQVSIRVGVQGAMGWVYRDVPYKLNQIGASGGENGLVLQLDRKAYYPGETAHVTIQSDRAGADVLLTVSREKVRYHHRFVINGTTGIFDLPVDELGAPNLFFHAVAVSNDTVHSANVEIPVVPTNKFLKVEIETEKEAYPGGGVVAAVVKVNDWKGKPVADAEVSLAAVLSSAFVLQEDLTPDLSRYFLNHRLPLWVTLGGSELTQDHPRDDTFWLAPVFAWGVYNDLAQPDTGAGRGSFGQSSGGGRRLMVKRHGGSRATESAYDAYSEFLRQHGLTIFHEARLVTDKDGRAKVQFLLPSSSGEFRFTARAMTAGTLVGEIRRTVKFRQDVSLQTPWPASVREGEKFQSPIFVVNNSDKTQSGSVTISSDLAVKVLASPKVTVAAGAVARVDFELDAHELLAALADPKSGYLAPLTFARFSAAFVYADGTKISNDAMVPVVRAGIPVERRTVALVSAGRGSKDVRFDLRSSVPSSVRLQIRPLASPKEIVRWLLEDLKQHENGDCYAWASEAVADSLPASDIAAGKYLAIEAPLLGALSSGVHLYGRPSCFLALSSARRRGVRIPAGWTDGNIEHEAAITDTETLRPFAAWALAESLTQPDAQNNLAVRLEKMRDSGSAKWQRSDWAFLALAMQKLDRKSKASWCLDKALDGVQLRRREHVRELPLDESAALLLAGARIGLDNETLGALYESVLEALSRTQRPEPLSATLAVHGMVAWSKLCQAPAEPLKLSLNGVEKVLQPAAILEEFPQTSEVLSVSIAPPSSGAVAAEIICSYRLPGDETQRSETVALGRRFIRVDRDGTGQWLKSGDALRLGDTLLVLIEPQTTTTLIATSAHVGPWEGMPIQRFQFPSKRVRREFILSTERREHVLAAVEERRCSDARTEMLSAISSADYLEEIEGGAQAEGAMLRSVDSEKQSTYTQYKIDPGQRIVTAYKPDRTGDFLAPTAWLNTAIDNTPIATASPFTVRVLDAEAPLPAPLVELHVREDLRKRVSRALTRVPESFLCDFVATRSASIDLRRAAFLGLLHSKDSGAAEAYASLRWPVDANDAFSSLREAVQFYDASDADLATEHPFGSSVLKRALESEELAERLAGVVNNTGLARMKTVTEQARAAESLFQDLVSILALENDWRLRLYTQAHGAGELDGIGSRPLSLKDVLHRVDPEHMDTLLRCLNHVSEVKRWFVRGPTLKTALSNWAAGYGLTIAIAENVPDLQAEEFVLGLPQLPSVKSLDDSLRGLHLRARYENREVRISVDDDWIKFRPQEGEFLSAKSPEGRLRVYLNQYRTSVAQLKSLAQPPKEETGYTPRVEFPADLAASEFMDKLSVDSERPLSEQIFALRAQGLRLEMADGVLRFSLPKQRD